MTREGVNIVVDQQRPGDTTIKQADEVVPVMDKVTADRLDGHTINSNETTERLVFT